MAGSIRVRMNLFYIGTLGVLIFGLYFLLHNGLRDYLLDKIRSEMRQNVNFLDAYLNRTVLKDGVPKGFVPELSQDFTRIKKRLLPYRITLIVPDGTVIADSDSSDPDRFENHKYRTEIVKARKSGTGSSLRYSETFRRDMLYFALGRSGYTLRVARLLTDVDAEMAGAERYLLLTSLLLLVIVFVLNILISWRLTIPIKEMREFVERYEGGGHPYRMPVRSDDELGALQSTLNNMAERIDRLVHLIRFEKQRLESVIATVTEGLVLINGSGAVTLVNRVFLRFFTQVANPVTLPYYRVIDSNELNEQIERALEMRERIETSVELTRMDPVILEVSIIPVEEERGLLVIMRDITARRKFEKAKSDFVSNASHELKTPLSIIGGYVETLLDPEEPPEETRRNFLARINSNVERLKSIVADITSLNKLEEGARHYKKRKVELLPLLDGVLESLRPAAERAGITLSVKKNIGNVVVKGVAQMLESVFYNLVDNAIKYNRPDGAVELSCEEDREGWVRVTVRDEGIGFSPAAAERLFERFYRTDTGRSREMGGTGLGLAIVKHAVGLHGGQVEAESRGPGEGALFIVTLPVHKKKK